MFLFVKYSKERTNKTGTLSEINMINKGIGVTTEKGAGRRERYLFRAEFGNQADRDLQCQNDRQKKSQKSSDGPKLKSR